MGRGSESYAAFEKSTNYISQTKFLTLSTMHKCVFRTEQSRELLLHPDIDIRSFIYGSRSIADRTQNVILCDSIIKQQTCIWICNCGHVFHMLKKIDYFGTRLSFQSRCFWRPTISKYLTSHPSN